MNSFVTYSGWLATIASLVVTFVLYKKGRIFKHIELSFEGIGLVSFPTNTSDFIAKLNDKEVGARFSRVQLSLRNRGNAGIERSDARSTAFIDVEVDGGEVLGAYVGYRGEEQPPISLRIKQNANRLDLSWDYIDSGEAIPIVVYTSGTYKSVTLKGTFRNGIKVKNTKKEDQGNFKIILILAFVEFFISLISSAIYSFMVAFHLFDAWLPKSKAAILINNFTLYGLSCSVVVATLCSCGLLSAIYIVPYVTSIIGKSRTQTPQST